MRIKNSKRVKSAAFRMLPYGGNVVYGAYGAYYGSNSPCAKSIRYREQDDYGNIRSKFRGAGECAEKARIRRSMKKSARTEWKKDVQPSIDDVLFLEWEQDCKAAEWYDYDDDEELYWCGDEPNWGDYADTEREPRDPYEDDYDDYCYGYDYCYDDYQDDNWFYPSYGGDIEDIDDTSDHLHTFGALSHGHYRDSYEPIAFTWLKEKELSEAADKESQIDLMWRENEEDLDPFEYYDDSDCDGDYGGYDGYDYTGLGEDNKPIDWFDTDGLV